MQKKLVSLVILVVVYLASAFFSYTLFSRLSSKPPVPTQTATTSSTSLDDSGPKTEECPINGVKYSTTRKNWWEQHRPLGVMIENSTDARPQSGLSYADTVYEAVAEGGITRFLAVFYCQDAPFVGPVRSARTYFVDFISEYGDAPLYAHVGGANTAGPADALGQISTYGWDNKNDMNEFAIGCPVYCRDYDRIGHEVATEHTMYSSTTKLWNYAKTNRKLTNVDADGNAWDKNFVKYSFKDDAALSDRPASQTIDVSFWSGYGDYAVEWVYDKATNTYKRSNGGKPHIDLDTKKQLAAKNIVDLFMRESSANDGYENNLHNLYGDKGTGNAVIFMDGKRTNGTWEKDSRTDRTIIKDKSGNEIKFDRGLIWFQILPLEGDVTVK